MSVHIKHIKRLEVNRPNDLCTYAGTYSCYELGGESYCPPCEARVTFESTHKNELMLAQLFNRTLDYITLLNNNRETEEYRVFPLGYQQE